VSIPWCELWALRQRATVGPPWRSLAHALLEVEGWATNSQHSSGLHATSMEVWAKLQEGQTLPLATARPLLLDHLRFLSGHSAACLECLQNLVPLHCWALTDLRFLPNTVISHMPCAVPLCRTATPFEPLPATCKLQLVSIVPLCSSLMGQAKLRNRWPGLTRAD
jgi:hypothetical protein